MADDAVRLALDERATMIRSLASLDMPIGFSFASTIAGGKVPSSVPVPVAMNAIRAARLWGAVTDACTHPLDVEQVRKYALIGGLEVNADDFIGTAERIIRVGWPACPVLAAVCASHVLLCEGVGFFDPRRYDGSAGRNWDDVMACCVRRIPDGLTDMEREEVYADA